MTGPDASKLKVLIVEDESLVAMLVEDILLDLGYEVAAVAGRLDQGIQLANDLAVDLAVLDLNLNGQSTVPIATILKARGIPFVFATGYGAAGVPEEWRHTPVVQKPFHAHDLEVAIKAVKRQTS